MKIAILRNEDPGSCIKWELACQKLNLEYQIIDLTSAHWLSDVRSTNFDFFLLKPPGLFSFSKTIYDERIYIISKVLKFETYPSFEECYIYENKKLLSDFLSATGLPHPRTWVFYDKAEAINFINKVDLPVVAKTTIGASGTGVRILKKHQEAEDYIKRAFNKGVRRHYGPNKAIGTPQKWVIKALNDPAYLLKKIKHYYRIYKNTEKDYVIFQEYIPHDFEWRAVKIGESYFAHKKIKFHEKASGSKGIDYVDPPVELLNFVKCVCENHGFTFMAIDLFEKSTGEYLINELQTLFGHVQKYIMSIDGRPGRYIFKDSNWFFEAGDFNSNESYDLRLQVVLDKYKNK